MNTFMSSIFSKIKNAVLVEHQLAILSEPARHGRRG
jgi:hypothetical protein